MVDEWEATGGEILAPWQEGTLQPTALFQAHNGDHRIVATRLFEILCFQLNGAWDPLLVMTVKAGVYAAAATVFVHLLTTGLRTHRNLAAGLLCVLFAFPFNYQNMIWAFQSQFDFFLLTVALGWWALMRGRMTPALVFSFLALFTLGAGPLLAMSYIPYLFLKRGELPGGIGAVIRRILAAGLIAGVGISMRTNEAAPIGSPGRQLETLSAALAWPYSNLLAQATSPRTAQLIPAAVRNFPSADNSWFRRGAAVAARHPASLVAINIIAAMVILSPVGVLAMRTCRDRLPIAHGAGPVVVACFAFLAAVATSVARAGQSSIPVRFLDLIVLLGFASIVALFFLRQEDGRWRRWILLWVICMLPGYLAIMAGTVAKLRLRLPAYWLANMQPYFLAHDHRVLADNRDSRWPIMENAPMSKFMNFLDDPKVAAILPHSLTQPAAPLPLAANAAGFARRWSGCLALLAGSLMLWLLWGAPFVRRYGPSLTARDQARFSGPEEESVRSG